jgi:hypothetical protein
MHRRRMRVISGSGNQVWMILGQSNASGRGSLAGAEAADDRVWMLANDYVYKQASESIDDSTDQVDAVSDDLAFAAHGPWLRAMKGLLSTQATGTMVLVPCAKSSESIANWMPGADRYDRATMFGSANYRRVAALAAAAPARVRGLLIWEGESNSSPAAQVTFLADWSAWIAAFRRDYGNIPVIYVQLAKRELDPNNTYHNQTAELMRQLESGYGASAIPQHYMVVSFDQGLINAAHVNQAGQKVIGDRVALAIRQHIYGQAVDGTGPRLSTISQPAANKVKVDTTQELAAIAADADGQFRVYDDGVEMTVSSVVQDVDTSAVLITMSASATGTVTVSYGDVPGEEWNVAYANVVKNAAGLPLPQFGLQTV